MLSSEQLAAAYRIFVSGRRAPAWPPAHPLDLQLACLGRDGRSTGQRVRARVAAALVTDSSSRRVSTSGTRANPPLGRHLGWIDRLGPGACISWLAPG
jgi:hypothetical protein